MKTSSFQKLRLLLWKNYIVAKRHPWQTLLEYILPIVFAVVLLGARGVINSTKHGVSVYSPWSPSDVRSTILEENLLNHESENDFFAPSLYRIYYTPDTENISKIMNFLQDTFLSFEDYAGLASEDEEQVFFNVTAFKSEAELLSQYALTEDNVLAAVVFNKFGEEFEYTLRFPQKPGTMNKSIDDFLRDDKWLTETMFPMTPRLGPRRHSDNYGGAPGYHYQGFTYLQYALDASLIHFVNSSVQVNKTHVGPYQVLMERFPYSAFVDDLFVEALSGWLCFVTLLCFIYPVINVTKSIVLEKEKRLKESMKMMGLPNYLHWMAWFIKAIISFIPVSFLVAGIYKFKYTDGLGVLTHTSFSLFLVYLLAFNFTSICLCFLMSTLFSKANSASLASGLIWILLFIPFSVIQIKYHSMGQLAKLFSCLSSNVAFAMGCQVISTYEATGAGLQWAKMHSPLGHEDEFSFFHAIVMMLIDGVAYFLLALYIEAVWPGEFGVARPWYFLVTKSYWCGSGGTRTVPRNYSNGFSTSSAHIEPPSSGVVPGIRIKDLTKKFGSKAAVKGLSLEMYQNQITALLGHNGAGKTTTMSMLTGLFPPTSGTAYLDSYDIRTDLSSIRQSLGLCPQHDVLFDELTVEEHLQFFCLMKGCTKVDQEVNRMITLLSFDSKRHALSHTLSGGMKRKLCVGIALVGGSKIVLLDEPTSGMDPGARRFTWDILVAEKKNRTIVLSTHFMEEADLLGDRIAIMADGQLQTVGSSLFLKKKYGAGYQLVIVKKPGCKVSRITTVIKQHLGQAEIKQDVGAELSYSLPDDQATLFPDLFDELEKRKAELLINSYGASITTMEEVFMRVGKEAEDRKCEESSDLKIPMEAYHHSHEIYKQHEMNTGLALWWQQFWAILVKKSLWVWRNWLLVLVQCSVPVGYLIILFTLRLLLPGLMPSPDWKVTVSNIPDNVIAISCRDNVSVCQTYGDLGLEAGSIIQETGNVTKYILEGAAQDILHIDYSHFVALEKTGNVLTTFFNNQPYHGPPMALNFITNALLREFSSNSGARIEAHNFPLPDSKLAESEKSGTFWTVGFQVGLFVSLGMSYLASSFVVFLIKERESKAKNLQFVSGAKYISFWFANFIVDMAEYIVSCGLILLSFLVFQVDNFTEPETLGYISIVFVCYGWAVIPLMYLWSFAFESSSAGFLKMMMFNLITGQVPLLMMAIMQIPQLGMQNVIPILNYIFSISPNYNLGIGIIGINKNILLHDTCPLLLNFKPDVCENLALPCCTEYPYGHFDLHSAGIGINIIGLLVAGLLGFIILFLVESKVFQKLQGASVPEPHEIHCDDPTEDSDVAAEASRIRKAKLTELCQEDNLVIQNLSKSYGAFTAVQCLNLGVGQGECFGLLGVNGAGKTTTFKMLTGDLPVTAGDAFIYGHSVSTDIKNVQKNLGYCPQFDALIPELTGRETIRLFARLRGIKEEEIDDLVDSLGANLLFSMHMEKQVGTYSGGNKRKLSTAIALVGNPPLIFLDEPTTGMDPVARRYLWNCISKVREAGTSIVLTSHSMEECEALCTRLAIMVNGQFRCLGSIQHLKSKFGEGYTIIAQVCTRSSITKSSLQATRIRRSSGHSNAWEKEIEPLKHYIEESFPGSTLKDAHPGYVHYHVYNPKLTWGDLFRKMENAKDLLKLEAYSVGQTSLEQVFLNFTKNQIATDDD